MSHQEKLTSIPDWAKAISDEAYFAQEQACLGEVWHFLGFESDIPKVNDWFRTRLGGRSIFVQRFKEGLRAFENICPHRFNQIRCEDKGNSPVVCGFHHWRFDSHGDAVGIPKCKEYYGKTPKEIDARLHAVELAVCGGFIFGRFGSGESLKAWLGDGYDILNYMATDVKLGGVVDFQVSANWRLMMQISLDDYHAAAVHPTTFGKDGYLPVNRFHYFRLGPHSTLMMAGDLHLKGMAAACAAGTFSLKKGHYIIFQFFPTFVVACIHATQLYGDDYSYLLIQHFEAQSSNKTRFHTRFFLMPFNRPAGLLRRFVRQASIPFVDLFFKHYMQKINKEDNQVCENIQQVSHQINGEMRPSALEERLGWFEDVYAKYVTDRIKQKND